MLYFPPPDSQSEIDGLMHACGHDSHAAMVLGAARILNDHKDELSGKIYVKEGEQVNQEDLLISFEIDE